MTDLVPTVRRHRTPLIMIADASIWIIAFVMFAWLRFEQQSDQVPWAEVVAVGAAAAMLYLALGAGIRLHQGRTSLASFSEMVSIGLVTALAGTTVFVVNLFTVWMPRSVPAGATFATLVLVVTGRATWRWLRERFDESAVSAAPHGAARVLVVGAGDGGKELIGSMLRDPNRTWHPVGLLDDDPYKRHRRIRNVPVLGATGKLSEAVTATGAETVIIAIPSADADTIQRLSAAAHDAEVTVKVLPSTNQLLTDHVGIRDIRDINLTDVLGRNQLDTDIDAIAGYLTGRRVLVTGAGGSIGSELCRQIHRFAPAELMMLDRDESALHAVQLSIHGRALLDSDDVVLCDIRDAKAVTDIFLNRRPEVVFHAAALKHLPMLEQYPAEAVKTNVVGTHNVLEAARLSRVERFVNISTDKAANPASVLGYSKRIAEGLTAAHASKVEGTNLSVRFGNVLGSRGSVLTAFAKQISAGGPVTVTDPDVTRYFMTIEEACQLVIQAAAIGRAGEALVLDMGEPIRIIDVARQLIRQAGRRVPVVFTGLRPGEKLHEELFGDYEPQDVRPEHAMVSHVPVPRVSQTAIMQLPTEGHPDEVRRAMEKMCEAMDLDSRVYSIAT